MTLLDLWQLSYLLIAFYIEYENNKSNKTI